MLPDELLKDLIEHFSEISLGNTAVSTDVLGDAYEYLISKFADVTKQEGGRVLHPAQRRAADGRHPRPEGGRDASTTRPAAPAACCSGPSSTCSAAGGDPRTFFGKIYGQEKNLTTSAIARMNLVLHGIEDFQIVREDTLRNPAFTDSSTGGLATFDCVIANPPFSLKEWGRELWEADPWGRAVVRPAARELRRLRLGPAHGRVDGRRARPHGGRAAAGRAVPQGRRGPDPPGAARARPRRGGHRPRAEPLLRHRPAPRAS